MKGDLHNTMLYWLNDFLKLSWLITHLSLLSYNKELLCKAKRHIFT